ncbi:MAG: hypothetical protein P4L84_11715 [Isosphaeraceae bacterium]|nr:hypothetical protein [Isosphaeraceae bacterium]
MTLSSNALSQEIAVLADVFSDLGDRLLRAARELHKPGTPPDQTLIEEIEVSRQDLESLRDRSRQLAESLHIECPPPEALNSLHSLAALLDDVAEAEIRQSRSDEIRRRSHAVLQRVLVLAHTSDPDHVALRECQNLARGLHQQIADSPWISLPSEAERLAEGDHAFAHLLSLVEDRDELGDDVWAAHHEAVSSAFGKTLAAAAARSRLVIGQEHGQHSENGHHSADHAMAAVS